MPDSMEHEEYRGIENKLLLLYLVDKMDLPLSRGHITQFVGEGNYMNLLILQQSLAELVEKGYLDQTEDNHNTLYTITADGLQLLEYFEQHIPFSTRAQINKYVQENRKKVKKDFDITAAYFPNEDEDNYIVKCGVYEDERVLLELNVSGVTKEQARFIQNNWRSNVNKLYSEILYMLVHTDEPEENTETEQKSDDQQREENEGTS